MEQTSPITQVLTTDIVSLYDIHKPERMMELYRTKYDQGSDFFLTLESLGFTKESKLDTYEHFEKDWIHDVFHSNETVASPLIGASIAITLSSDDLDTDNNFYPRERDIVIFPNRVTGIITDIDVSTPTAPVLTIVPNDPADTIPAVTAGDELVITSSAFSERSNQPESAFAGTYKYTNDAQIIKETFDVSGSEKASQTWFRLNNVEGAPYYNEGMADMEFRLATKIDGALLMQKRTTNPAAIDSYTGKAVKTTEGLFPFVARLGNDLTYTAGTFAVSNFNTMDRILSREFVGPYSLAKLGIELHQNAEDSLVSYFQNTNIEFAVKAMNNKLFDGNETLAAHVGFSSLMKSERLYNFSRFKNLTNPKTYGATGYNFPKEGIVMPLDSKQAKDVNGNKLNISSIGARYRGFGQYNRKMKVWKYGAAAAVPLGQIDEENTFMLTHMGFHGIGGDRFIHIYAA